MTQMQTQTQTQTPAQTPAGQDLAGPPLAAGAFDLSITRSFDAPVALVFSIWETREHMIQWWGPKNFTTPHLELDFRIGGGYRACIVSPAGRESWMAGTFREIVKNERIVMTFTWEDGRDPGVETLITVTFSEEGGKTVQRFHQTPFLKEESRDSHIGGWSECFDGEQQYLDTMNQGSPS